MPRSSEILMLRRVGSIPGSDGGEACRESMCLPVIPGDPLLRLLEREIP